MGTFQREGRGLMYEIVEGIHKALRIESTWAFVLIIALGFGVVGGGIAWIIDLGYRNSAEYKADHPDPKAQAAVVPENPQAAQTVATPNPKPQSTEPAPNKPDSPIIANKPKITQKIPHKVKTEESKPEPRDATPVGPVTKSPLVYNGAGGKFQSVCGTFNAGGRTAIENHGEVKSDRDSFNATSSCSPSEIKVSVLDDLISKAEGPSFKDTVGQRMWARQCVNILQEEFDEQTAKGFMEQPDLDGRIKFLRKLKASINP
jgi:hypothetical protein